MLLELIGNRLEYLLSLTLEFRNIVMLTLSEDLSVTYSLCIMLCLTTLIVKSTTTFYVLPLL